MVKKATFDSELQKIRMNVASEDKSWKKIEKQRERAVTIFMIAFVSSIFLITFIMTYILGLPDYTLITLISIIFWLFPGYFISKYINTLTNQINNEKEKFILDLYCKTENLEELELKSGIPANFITYYLKKNNKI